MPTTPRKSWLATIVMTVIFLAPCLYGFGGKFLEFIHIFRGSSEGVFAISPIVNYLLASGGFFCLLAWATFNGTFRDIEAPKHSFLENEDWLDRQESTAP